MMNNDSTRRPRVLLAHRDPEILGMLIVASDAYDLYEWEAASTGEDVVNLLNRTSFDAAILSSRFPDITGTMMAELIKAHFPYINGAFLTSHSKGLFKSRAEDLNFEIWSQTKSFDDLHELCNNIYCLGTGNWDGEEPASVLKSFAFPRIFKEIAQFSK